MSYSTKSILKNIRIKKDLEKSLKDYADVLTTDYNQYAMFAFSMNYFILYESLQDDEDIDEDIKICVEKVNDIIKRCKNANFEGEERQSCILELENIRNEVIARMDTLADYAERLLIYDYVIERTKYRIENKEVKLPSNEDMANEIMQYIVGVKDNVVASERIREVLSQLPIRMAKGKFFDLVSNSMTLYKDGDISALESFIYKLRSSATLYTSKGEGKFYTDIGETVEKIKNVDFENITKEKCGELMDDFNRCKEKIEVCSEYYYSLQEVINQAYALILTRVDILEERTSKKDNEVCMDIIERTCECFDSNYEIVIPENEIGKFSFLEGRQEEYYYNFSNLESELFSIRKEYADLIKSENLSEQYKNMDKCEKLLSTSLFVELSDDEESETADEDYIKEASIKLQTEFSELFKNSSKQIKRSIMSNVISKLPIFFENLEETKNYIVNAFDSCRDIYEKKAAYDIIVGMIRQDNYDNVIDEQK